MPFNIKMFDTLGAITLITPPSMMNPGEISFLLIDLKEQQKNEFDNDPELQTYYKSKEKKVY